MISAHLLLLTYFELAEHDRILRYLETSTDANNELKSLIESIAARKEVHPSVASNCLHIIALKAECYLLTGAFTKGAYVFNQVCHLYNNWHFGAQRIVQSENMSPEE